MGESQSGKEVYPVKIVVAMPAYNEEKYVASTVLKCRKHSDEVYVIDDCSKDLTGELAKRAGANVIRHEQNQGYGGALRTAFMLGKETDADCLVILDSDGQHDPNSIPDLVEPIRKERADLVIGSRFKSKEGRSMIPRYRILGIQAITQVFNLGANIALTDSQSGFRAYSKKALESIKVTSDRMDASMEILFDAKDHKFKILEVPIIVKYEGVEGSSEAPVSHGVKVLMQTVKFMRERYPLRFFGGLGSLILISIPLISMISYTYYPPETGILVPGTMYVITFLAILGTFLLFTGVMLHGVNRISDTIIRTMLE
jgi:glycosyltransferase involved in cell wall biosynthesis